MPMDKAMSIIHNNYCIIELTDIVLVNYGNIIALCLHFYWSHVHMDWRQKTAEPLIRPVAAWCVHMAGETADTQHRVVHTCHAVQWVAPLVYMLPTAMHPAGARVLQWHINSTKAHNYCAELFIRQLDVHVAGRTDAHCRVVTLWDG